MLDKQAKKWLESYADLLDPEDIIFEEEKLNYTWPQPKEPLFLGNFRFINSTNSFNYVLSSPDNWEKLKYSPEILHNWVVPHAALLFGKKWFDKVKKQPRINAGIPFPLFSKEYRERFSSIDQSPAGRAKILQIYQETEKAVKSYINTQWYEGTCPSKYITKAIKNNIIKETATVAGYKLRPVPACPNCLSQGIKTKLIRQDRTTFSCPNCQERAQNIELIKDKTLEQKYQLERAKVFTNFRGAVCVCPNNYCSGIYVPIPCKDIIKTPYTFKSPPKNLLNHSLICPFCEEHFTPALAMWMGTGFKGKGGYLTGLPFMFIWKGRIDTDVLLEIDKPSSYSIETKIFAEERINIIINIIRSKQNKKNTLKGLLNYYFYIAMEKWVNNYWYDAIRYFFSMSNIKDKRKYVIKGEEATLHHSFFNIWMDVLEENIKEFEPFNIKKLSDFEWFCRKPKFSVGQKSSFVAEIDSQYRVYNSINMRETDGYKPRMARILSVKKEGIEYIDEIQNCEWQSIQFESEGKLKIGDKVKIVALFMSGHPTHSPIQRFIRFRRKHVEPVVRAILEEEGEG